MVLKTYVMSLIHAHEINSYEINSHEINSHQINSHQINSHQINSHEINSHQINSHEIDFSGYQGSPRNQLPNVHNTKGRYETPTLHTAIVGSQELWEARTVSDVQVCHQRHSSASDLLLIFLCFLIQALTLTPPPNNALLANMDMRGEEE